MNAKMTAGMYSGLSSEGAELMKEPYP